MVTLCKRKYPNVDDTVILNLVTEAFPIVVYAKQLENKQRRMGMYLKITSKTRFQKTKINIFRL